MLKRERDMDTRRDGSAAGGILRVVVRVDRATSEDLEHMLEIAAARRGKCSGYQPRFWRLASDAVHRRREFFASLLSNGEALIVVARGSANLRGFAIGRLVPAPPVYAPGGDSCLIDDFAVADPKRVAERRRDEAVR